VAHVRPSPSPRSLCVWQRQVLGLLLLLLLTGAPGCRSPRTTELERLAPRLDPGLARLLEERDGDGVLRYARDNGEMSLRAGVVALWDVLPVSDDFPSVEARLIPPITLLLETHARVSGTRAYLDGWNRYLRRAVDDRRRAIELWQRGRATAMDASLDPARKVEALRSLIPQAVQYSDIINVGDFYSGYVEFLPGLGRASELPGDLNHAAELSLEFGDTTLACQFLGMLGHHFGQLGQTSLQEDTWVRGLELARRSRSWQEARLLNHYALLHRSRGEEAEGLRVLAAAESVSAIREGGMVELRFLIERMSALATLSLWEIVDRGLARGELLLRQGDRQLSRLEQLNYRAGLYSLRMRRHEARGESAEAVRAARQLLSLIEADSLPPSVIRHAPRACYVLARFGYTGEALRALDRTIENSHRRSLPNNLPVCFISRAEILELQGDTAGVAASLADFCGAEQKGTPERRYWIMHDAIRASLAYESVGRDSAARIVALGLLDLENRRDLATASVEVQLRQATAERFRRLIHEMYADRPEVGYAFELAWPRLYSGRGRNPDALDPSDVAFLAAEGRVPLPVIDPDAVHCVYHWGPQGLVRWMRRGDVVERQVVSTETARLESQLEKLHSRLARSRSGNAATLDRGTLRELYQLATLLLPSELLGDSDRARLIVTRSGPLSQLPFELLNLESGRPRPLSHQRDIEYAYVIGAPTWWPGDESSAPRVAADNGTILVVANPAYDDHDRRRISLLAEPLTHTADEARAAVAGEPDALFLSGSAATRDSVLSLWESASRIHVASHFVQDPEFLYLSYLPLASSGTGRRYIDLRDIRRADLRRCRLAILSGCQTGVRYRTETTELPSLAEGMIAAGAHHVVATHWDVSDAEAARVMREFHRELSETPGDPVGALGRVRRALFDEGAPHDVWAAFTIFSNESVTTIPRVESETAWTPFR
jgi:CHAT domain-containing protein